MLKDSFPEARIVNFSATPLRADGRIMEGQIIYSYPIFRAIQEGYVKQLKAIQLNPRSLKYVRKEDGEEIEVDLEQVRALGESDSDFRRSIVTSEETLTTIVDASIRELDRIREETNEPRLKIIASALNYDHCSQIVAFYRARGKRADYVHSREDSSANNRVMQKLDNHELDVIVQVRKLGEGFDHPYLSVAAVFSVFSNLSPFVQFVGRIMRVITQNSPNNPLNRGTVIFHAGANIAKQWSDFQQFSEADQEYFDQLLPMEGLDPDDPQEQRTINPVPSINSTEVRSQSDIELEEIPLSIQDDEDALAAIRVLQERGYSSSDVASFMTLQPVATTRAYERQAMRNRLDTRIQTTAAQILNQRSINRSGRELDKQHLGRTNLIVLKTAIDRAVNSFVGKSNGQRSEFSRNDLDQIEENYDSIVNNVANELFDA